MPAAPIKTLCSSRCTLAALAKSEIINRTCGSHSLFYFSLCRRRRLAGAFVCCDCARGAAFVAPTVLHNEGIMKRALSRNARSALRDQKPLRRTNAAFHTTPRTLNFIRNLSSFGEWDEHKLFPFYISTSYTI